MNKKFTYKIRNEYGYSISNVLILIMILSSLSIFISTQISRQIKSTTKRTNEIQLQYTSEAGIDRAIEEILMEINKLKSKQSYSKILKNTDQDYVYLIRQEVNNLIKINNVDMSNLNRAINNINYNDTIESIISNLNDVRTELLNIVKDNPSKRKEIKDDIDNNISKICTAIDYANIEKNKNVSAIEIDGSIPRGFMNYCEDLNAVIGNNKDKYGNTYDDIVLYMSSAWSKVDKIHEYGQKNSMNVHLEETKKLVSLAQNIHTVSNSNLKGKLSQYSSKFNVWDPNEQTQKQILEQTKKDLKEIEGIIDDYISYIRNIRKEIYSSYTYCMANYTLYAEDDLKRYTDDAMKMYDSIEDQLMWFKKKIGISSSSNDNNGNESSDSDSNDDNTTIINPSDIILNEYSGEFDVMNSDYRYVVKYEMENGDLVDEITLPIKSQNLKNINIKLVSIATNGNSSYKTRANIEFNIDGAINYKVNSYEHIN